jgi:phosphoglycerate kinase
MDKLSVNQLNVKNQRVLVRVDYNVPMEEKDGKMVINDDTRIRRLYPLCVC